MSSYVVGFAIITPTMSSMKSVKFPHDASAEVFILLVPGIISCFVSIAKESLNCVWGSFGASVGQCEEKQINMR